MFQMADFQITEVFRDHREKGHRMRFHPGEHHGRILCLTCKEVLFSGDFRETEEFFEIALMFRRSRAR